LARPALTAARGRVAIGRIECGKKETFFENRK